MLAAMSTENSDALQADSSTAIALDRSVAGPVLVVGGAGYIGSHMVRALEDNSVECVVFDNLSTGNAAAVQSPLVVGDLGNRDQIEAVFDQHSPKGVFHFAAKSYVGESVENPAMYYRENVTNTWNLLEVMRERQCLDMVFSSTCATFGVPASIPIEDDAPQAPISPYGRTKLAIEHMLDDYATAYGLRYAALRYFNAAAAHPDGQIGEAHDPETHLIPLILEVAAGRRDEILIFGDDYPTPDGTCIRDYIHVLDLADAHLRAMAELQAGVQRLRCNLGTGSGYSVREVIEAARRVTQTEITERVVGRRPGDPPELVSGGVAARSHLGFEPKFSDIDVIVADAWRFMQRHPRGYDG
jgi:UDP-glucose 4-epimerase